MTRRWARHSALDYADKTLLIFSGSSSSISFCSFTAIFGTPVGIVSASISLVFHISNRIIKVFLKTMGKKKTNKERLFYWLEINEIA